MIENLPIPDYANLVELLRENPRIAALIGIGILVLSLLVVAIVKYAIREDDTGEKEDTEDLEGAEDNLDEIIGEKDDKNDKLDNKVKEKEETENPTSEDLKEDQFSKSGDLESILQEKEGFTDDVKVKQDKSSEENILSDLNEYEKGAYEVGANHEREDNYIIVSPDVKILDRDAIINKHDINFTLNVHHNNEGVGKITGLEDTVKIFLNYNEKNNIKVYHEGEVVKELQDLQPEKEPTIEIIGNPQREIGTEEDFVLKSNMNLNYEEIIWTGSKGIEVKEGQGTKKVTAEYTKEGKQTLSVKTTIKESLELQDTVNINVQRKSKDNTKNEHKLQLDKRFDEIEKELNKIKNDGKVADENGSFKASAPGAPIENSDLVEVKFENTYKKIENEKVKDKETGNTPHYDVQNWIRNEKNEIVGGEFWVYLGSEPTEKEFIYKISGELA